MRHVQSLHRTPLFTSAQTPNHLAHSSGTHHTATLIEAMADASAEQLVTWSRESVIRELLGSVAMFVCYFVFDWWGVSTATQIRLYAGLLSVLPL